MESKRGGGGYIRITRVRYDKPTAVMHFVNSIGDSIDSATARVFLENLIERSMINPKDARLISAAISDNCLKICPNELRDKLRAAILKQMLTCTLL